MTLRTAIFSLLLAVYSISAAAQEAHEHAHPETGRVPANILPAERAGILLMEQRDALEQPETTLDLMQLKDGDVVADLGCGNGYYTLRLAQRVAPTGKVLAVDIQQGMLDQLQARMTEAGIENVELILGEFDDPKLPAGGVDWLMLVDVYHEFSDPQAMLAKIRECLAHGGKVALLEYRAEQDPATIAFPIPRDHKMTVEEVLGEWIPAGFRLVEQIEVLPAQHIFFFEVADQPAASAYQPLTMTGTINVTAYDNGTAFFAGQPNEADLKTFANLGVKSVLNLRGPSEMDSVDFDESAKAAELGMAYTNIPMGREIPEDEQLDAMFDAIDAAGDAPILIHCASSNRVGAVWALYQALRGGRSIEESIAAGRAAGMGDAFVETVTEKAGK